MYTKNIVVRTRDISDDIFELLFQRCGVKTIPGDQICIQPPAGGEFESKPIWVASGIKEPWVRILCDKMFHPWLSGLKYPSTIKIETVTSVYPDLIKDPQPCFCVSGTGIAVPMSYISTYPQKRVEIVYLGRTRIQEEYLKARCDLKDAREEGKIYYECH